MTASATSSGYVDWGATSTLSIAAAIAAPGVFNYWFDGYIDEVRVYDRVLNTEQINREMNFNSKLTFAYDANGNMTDRDGKTLVWNAENRLQRVEAEDDSWIETYVYDADGGRVAKKYWDGSTTTTTLYVNGMWERDIDNDIDTINLSLSGRYVASYTKVRMA